MKMIFLLCFALSVLAEDISYDSFKIDSNKISLSERTRYLVFPNVFSIDLDSNKLIWLSTPDTAGIVFAKWFAAAYSIEVDSLQQEIRQLSFQLKKERNKK